MHPHAPALVVATHLCENKILHKKVREQGGAYGTGASYNATLGLFTFHSFRDPHIAQTWNTFHESLESIAGGNFTLQDMEESKLGIIQHEDVPLSPGTRALTAYSWWRNGRTKQMRQEFRDRLLRLTPKDVTHALATDLLPKINEGIFVSFAGKDLIESERIKLQATNLNLPLFPI